MKNRIIASILIISLFGIVFGINFVSAVDQNVCCEKTTKGLFCQNVPSTQCASGSKQAPTSCESTSFCREGTCYDSKDGTCSDNTPQLVCNNNGGVWSENSPPQCDLGCCVLGDQAAFVTLTRCKALSSQLGLQTNYKKDITNEIQCVLSVAGQEKGACVFESEFEKTCKFVTREECQNGIGKEKSKGEFHVGVLCSSEELGTNCAPTTKTSCVPGKDEVYFVDSCGNPANIYDSSKVEDKEYWNNVKLKSESCSPNSENGNNPNCGNCNYLLGSYCRDASKDKSSKQPVYGEFICSDLNCKKTSNGNSYRHGESWCVYDDEGEIDKSDNSVGSKYYKHICINGEEIIEPCADFRQEECIQDKIEIPQGSFSQAACRVNRWQDCLAQTEKDDCENTDKRDCSWLPGTFSLLVDKGKINNGKCVPKNTPGIKFWESEESKGICSQADSKCIITYEKGLFGGKKCIENCECEGQQWIDKQLQLCQAIGDCGAKINWQGTEGYKDGYKVKSN